MRAFRDYNKSGNEHFEIWECCSRDPLWFSIFSLQIVVLLDLVDSSKTLNHRRLLFSQLNTCLVNSNSPHLN